MLHWLGSLPGIVLFPLFAVIGLGITGLFDVIMRRYVKPETRHAASSTASVTLQVTATIYAILIAFVIVDAYTQIRSTQTEISTKAANLSVVFENSRVFPKAEGDAVRAAALAYGESVVQRGIPRLEEYGEPDLPTDHRLEQVFRALQQVKATTEGEKAAYAASVDALDGVVASREQLLNSSNATIPDTLLGLLFIIGMTVMAVATLLDTQHRRSHLFILGALALVIWLTLALVVSMNYPFSGPIRVTDEPIREFINFRAAR